jgi:hypothetical protein
MYSLEFLNPIREILYFSPEEYSILMDKISTQQELEKTDIVTLIGLLRDLITVSPLYQDAIQILKELNQQLSSSWFANQVDRMNIEQEDPHLYNQLSIAFFIVRGRVEEHESVIHILKTVELSAVKILDFVGKNLGYYHVPENAKAILGSVYHPENRENACDSPTEGPTFSEVEGSHHQT